MAQWSTNIFCSSFASFRRPLVFFFVYLEIITVEPKEISKYISCNFHCFFFFEIQKSYCHSFMIVFKCLAYFEGKLIKQGHLSKSARKHFKRLRVVTIWDLIMIVQRISLILGPWSMNNNVIIFLIHLYKATS